LLDSSINYYKISKIEKLINLMHVILLTNLLTKYLIDI